MNNIEQQIRTRINGNYLIGRYISSPTPHFIDIRGSEGEQLDLDELITGEVIIPCSETDLVENEFYQFEWCANDNGDFSIIGSVVPVDKDALIGKLLDIFKNKKGMDLADAIKNQELVLQEVTGSVKTYLYELLQNANDYPFHNEDVHVKFILTDKYLFFVHTGAEFDLLNIIGICSIHQGDKRNKKDAIGYKGIGFKTVFVKNNYVYLKSGDWSIRFDENASKEAKGGKAPWIRMPWKTDYASLDSEVRDILDALPEEFRVQFALRHKEDAAQNTEHLDRVFGDDEILLFIPNVTDVEVTVGGQVTHHVTKNRANWEIQTYKYQVPDDLREWVKEDIRRNGKTPPKFMDIETASISFAVKKNGKCILPMSNTKVYNYLPTQLSLGLPFIVNADFIPDASRSGLQPDLKWNEKMMSAAGKHLVQWMADLLRNRDEFDVNSVFDLYPKGNTNDHYASLFRNGAQKAFGEIPCIPVIRDESYELALPSSVIYDGIGLTTGDNPVLTDEEFCKFCGKDGVLPIREIRNNSNMKQILRDHRCIRFDENAFDSMMKSTAFQQWLKDESHSIRFLKFLIDSKYFGQYSNNPIILCEDGKLRSAGKVYLNIDSYVEDLEFLSSMLPRMNTKVRDAVSSSEEYEKFKTKLLTFSPFNFTRGSIFNKFSEIISLFYNEENSSKFFHFLAITGYELGIPSDYPLYNDKGKLCDEGDIYVKDEFGESVASRKWMSHDWLNFLSDRYFYREEVKVKQYFFKIGIKNLDEEHFCTDFLGNNDRIGFIASQINKDFNLSKDFFLFLAGFQHYQLKLSDGARNVLRVFTTDGEIETTSSIKNTIFNLDDEWQSIREKPWLPRNLANAISPRYFEEGSADTLKRFFTNHQVTQNYSIAGLFQNIVKPNLQLIFDTIDSIESSKDFLLFLFRNESTFFKGETPSNIYKNIPVKFDGNTQFSSLNEDESPVFYHTDKLDTLALQEWFNNDIRVLDRAYDDLFDGQDKRTFFAKLGFETFNLRNFLADVVLENPDHYIENLSDKDTNYKFHSYFCSIHKLFTETELEPLKDLPIFLSVPEGTEDECCESSGSHYIPSPALTELIKKDIVPIELMDAIHPDYVKSDEDMEYYVGILENVVLQTEDFIQYIVKPGNVDTVSGYLSTDRDRNIRFWRWVCDQDLEYSLKSPLKVLPVLITNQDGKEIIGLPESSYLADSYSGAQGVEDFIKQFIPNPQFISADYKEAEDDRDWAKLFSALGVIMDNKRIVFDRIIPNLSDYEQTSIVGILAKHTDTIAAKIRTDEKLKSMIGCLRLLCEDGEYRIPEDAYITGKYFDLDGAPIPDITPGYFVSESYLTDCPEDATRKIKDFMKLIADIYEGALDTLTKMRDAKIRYFLEHQDDYAGNREAHNRIIRDIAKEYEVDIVGVRQILRDREIPDIKLFTTLEVDLYDAGVLTLSSAYSPRCDFMACGVSDIDYVSEQYADLCPEIKNFFVSELGVRDDFDKDDLQYLSNRTFAVYFWEKFAPINKDLLLDILTEDNLKNRVCIPTISGLARPKDLYDYRIPTLKKMMDRISHGEVTDKLPSVELPRWLKDNETRLGFRSHLYFDDCISYLNLNIKDFRRDAIDWIINTPDEIIASHKEQLSDYLKSALWLNGEEEWVPLSGLVALEKDNRTLDAYFKSSPGVCNPSYMPYFKESYNRLCRIFGIKIITNDDFEKVPGDNSSADIDAIKEIKKRLLYIAFISKKENWTEIYSGYEKKIDNTDIRRCDTISYRYDDVIQTNLQVYSDSEDNLWYTRQWDGAPMGDIIAWLVRVLNLSIEEGLMKNIFWTDFNKLLNKYEKGAIPKAFYDLIDEADRKGLTIKQIEADESFRDVLSKDSVNTNIGGTVSQDKSVSVPPQTRSISGEDGSSSASSSATQQSAGIVDLGGSAPVTNSEVSTSANVSLQDDDFGSPSRDNSSQSHERPKVETSTRTSSGSHSDAPATKPKQNPTHYATPVSEPEAVQRESVEDRLRKEWDKKKQSEVRRPSTRQAWGAPYKTQETESSTATEDTFFNEGTSGQPSLSAMGASSKTSQRIKRSCTDAQNSANEAQDKLDMHRLFQQETELNKYSFRWFNLLMELMYSDRKKESHVEAQIDFSEFHLSNRMLVAAVPSKAIPKWLPNAENLSVSLIKNKKKYSSVNGRVSSMTEDAVWISLGEYDDLSSFESGDGKIRLNADGTTFTFIESLMIRFLQLGYDDSYNLLTGIPSNIKYIYGPPGTGKTHELVNRLLTIVSDEGLLSDTIVLAPTNRAADEIVERLLDTEEGRAHCYRFGDTQSIKILQSGNLISRDSCYPAFDRPRVMVTTAARFAYDYIDSNNAICEWSWDNVFIDEASMIDVATICFILHKANQNNEFTKFVIAGDPHQLQPVENNDVQPENIYNMVGLDSFSAAMKRPDVMGLTVQHRSVPKIGELVSKFAYDGMLQHNRTEGEEKALTLSGYKNLKNINFIGFKTEPLDMLYGIDSIGGSAFHIYSVILAYNFAEYIAKEVNRVGHKDYTIGIVCPFRAQADAIRGMLENRPIDNDCCSVKCGTVHKFQGSECDAVIVVMNTPSEVTSGSHVNNANLVNVAISRARDYLFIMTTDHSVDKFWTREALGTLSEEHSITFGHDLEKMIFGREGFIETNVNISAHMPVNIFYEPCKLYEVKIDEGAVDIQINDGLRID